MIPRQMKVDLLVMAISMAIILHSDREKGYLTIARAFRAYGSLCRDTGNWFYTQAIHADNAAQELVSP